MNTELRNKTSRLGGEDCLLTKHLMMRKQILMIGDKRTWEVFTTRVSTDWHRAQIAFSQDWDFAKIGWQPWHGSLCYATLPSDSNSVLGRGRDQHGMACRRWWWQARDRVEPRRRWDGGADQERRDAGWRIWFDQKPGFSTGSGIRYGVGVFAGRGWSLIIVIK